MEEIFKKMISRIKTKEDLIFFIEEINLLKKIVFKNAPEKLSQKAVNEMSEIFRNFLEELEKENLIPSSPEKQLILFEKLKEKLENLPQIRLEIAFRPSEKFILKIKKWLEEEMKKKIVLDIIINPAVVGGAIIEYQGRYEDFSLSKEIEKIFSKNNESF